MAVNPPTDALERRARKVLEPPPKLTVSEWADAERHLSPESNPEPGRWNTDRAPFQRGMMDAVGEDGVHTVVFMMGAQVGKTEAMLNIIGYHIHHDPAPILLLEPTLDLAEAVSKDRLAPMVRDTPALRGRVKDARSRDSENTLLHKKFPGGQITLAGANSPASLASRPVRIVLCDEIDRYPASAGTEGNPVQLAEKRASNFYNRFFVKAATPTIEGASPIAHEYEESDRRRYNIPCPLCEKLLVLKFPSLKWEIDAKGMPINVRYSCPHCEGEFDDSKKEWMLSKGEWVAEGTFRGIAGFHINALYSPWRKWVETVVEFLAAKKKTEDLKVFVNTRLSETWKEKGEAPEWERLFHARESYVIGSVQASCVFLTAGVDVQKDRLEIEIVGWGVGKESHSVDYIVLQGDTAKDETWALLDEVIAREFPRSSGTGSLPIRMTAVDSGFNTQQVYNWVRKQDRTRVIAVKGQDSLSMVIGLPTIVDINVRMSKKIRRGARVWPVGVSSIKSELYTWLRLQKPTDPLMPFPHGYCHFPEYGEEYFKMLTAEQMIVRKVKGFPRYEWQKTRDRNEALDCRVYARAAAAAVGMDRWTEAHWLEQSAMAGIAVAAPTPADPGVEVADAPAPTPEPDPKSSPSDGVRRRRITNSIWNRDRGR